MTLQTLLCDIQTPYRIKVKNDEYTVNLVYSSAHFFGDKIVESILMRWPNTTVIIFSAR